MPKKGTSWDKAWRPAAEALLHSLTLQGLPGVVAQAQNTAGEILDQPCETFFANFETVSSKIGQSNFTSRHRGVSLS